MIRLTAKDSGVFLLRSLGIAKAREGTALGRLLLSVNDRMVVTVVVQGDKESCSWICTGGLEMTSNQAIEFVREHGVVLESGRGPVPSLAEAVAQGPIKGSWWCHRKSREIFALTRRVRDNDDVLVCRVVGGKVTFVHRRLWPALVRLADRLPRAHLAQIREVHTSTGHHIVRTVPYPDWVSAEISRLALKICESEAIAQLGSWLA